MLRSTTADTQEHVLSSCTHNRPFACCSEGRLIAKEEIQILFCSLRSLAAARLGGPRKRDFLVFGSCCEQDQSEQARERVKADRAQALMLSKASPRQQSECKVKML